MNLNRLKAEFISGQYVFRIYFPFNFFENRSTDMPRRHFHAAYEVLFASYPDKTGDEFVLTPPLVEHYSYSSKVPSTACSFLFSMEPLPPGTAGTMLSPSPLLDIFLTLDKLAHVPDTFQGARRLEVIRQELGDRQAAYCEKINAEVFSLLVDLARRLPAAIQADNDAPSRNLYENRLLMIEEFVWRNFVRPDCSCKELADLLYVSERQLLRIIEKYYRRTFQELLTYHRMEAAEAYRLKYPYSAEHVATLVGYGSGAAFLAAYRKYFGHPFVPLRGKKGQAE